MLAVGETMVHGRDGDGTRRPLARHYSSRRSTPWHVVANDVALLGLDRSAEPAAHAPIAAPDGERPTTSDWSNESILTLSPTSCPRRRQKWKLAVTPSSPIWTSPSSWKKWRWRARARRRRRRLLHHRRLHCRLQRHPSSRRLHRRRAASCGNSPRPWRITAQPSGARGRRRSSPSPASSGQAVATGAVRRQGDHATSLEDDAMGQGRAGVVRCCAPDRSESGEWE